jgi:O-antigen/teichoic acid export membrane protein
MTREVSEPGSAQTRRIETRGRSLRAFTARGVLINSGFDIGLSLLGLLQGFVLAVFLTRADYGVWGILVVTLGVLARLKVIGISDKYIQQDEPDQELAFQRAFTLEMLVTFVALVPLGAALPIAAIVYGQWKLVPPGLVLLTVLLADAFQSPAWIFYRSMNFARQRFLTAIQPVVAFCIAVGLAVAGLGYWSLAIGVAVGAWAAAAAAVRACPFPIRWRYDRQALRSYVSFSVPIFISTLSGVVLANAAMIATSAHLGLAGAGALALAANVTAFTTRLDALISGTVYPAVCAFQHRLDLLRESFTKVNRVALMWAMPLGVGLTLFASDLVHFGIGEKWHAAIGLLEIMGVVAGISHIGFNWDDYYRARADTKPIAAVNVVGTSVVMATGIPLLFADGLTGLGVGIAVGAAADLLLRAWFVSRLFDGFAFASHSLRAVLPTVPAVVVVLAARAFETGSRHEGVAIAELVVYVAVTGAATLLLERSLLREVAGYIASRSREPAAA